MRSCVCGALSEPYRGAAVILPILLLLRMRQSGCLIMFGLVCHIHLNGNYRKNGLELGGLGFPSFCVFGNLILTSKSILLREVVSCAALNTFIPASAFVSVLKEMLNFIVCISASFSLGFISNPFCSSIASCTPLTIYNRVSFMNSSKRIG